MLDIDCSLFVGNIHRIPNKLEPLKIEMRIHNPENKKEYYYLKEIKIKIRKYRIKIWKQKPLSARDWYPIQYT